MRTKKSLRKNTKNVEFSTHIDPEYFIFSLYFKEIKFGNNKHCLYKCGLGGEKTPSPTQKVGK